MKVQLSKVPPEVPPPIPARSHQPNFYTPLDPRSMNIPQQYIATRQNILPSKT